MRGIRYTNGGRVWSMSSTGIVRRCIRSLRDMAMPMGTPNRTQRKAHTKMIARVCMANP